MNTFDKIAETLTRYGPAISFFAVGVSTYYVFTDNFQPAYTWMVLAYVTRNTK